MGGPLSGFLYFLCILMHSDKFDKTVEQTFGNECVAIRAPEIEWILSGQLLSGYSGLGL